MPITPYLFKVYGDGHLSGSGVWPHKNKTSKERRQTRGTETEDNWHPMAVVHSFSYKRNITSYYIYFL